MRCSGVHSSSARSRATRLCRAQRRTRRGASRGSGLSDSSTNQQTGWVCRRASAITEPTNCQLGDAAHEQARAEGSATNAHTCSPESSSVLHRIEILVPLQLTRMLLITPRLQGPGQEWSDSQGPDPLRTTHHSSIGRPGTSCLASRREMSQSMMRFVLVACEQPKQSFSRKPEHDLRAAQSCSDAVTYACNVVNAEIQQQRRACAVKQLSAATEQRKGCRDVPSISEKVSTRLTTPCRLHTCSSVSNS
jgi:hypothetical protein